MKKDPGPLLPVSAGTDPRRRRLLTTGTAWVASAVAAACGGGGDDGPPAPAPTPGPTPGPAPTPAPTATPSPTPAPTTAPAPTPTPAPTTTPAPTPAPTTTPAPTPTPTATPSPTPAPTVTPAPTPAPTATPAPTPAPTATPAPTPAPTATPAPTPAPTATPAPTPAPTTTPAPTPTPAPSPRKLLFIGNSFTGILGGIDTHVQAIAASLPRPRTLTVQNVWEGGATLARLRNVPAVLQAIRSGNHDVVVMQDDIPEYVEHSVAPFKDQVRWFVPEIRAKKARPVLYMAWAYERLNWVTMAAIAQAHRDIGGELGVSVAPVGLSFDAARAQRPALAMLDSSDDEHQSLAGMYLAACVIYATVFQETPEGATYVPNGLSADDAAFLQRVAWANALI